MRIFQPVTWHGIGMEKKKFSSRTLTVGRSVGLAFVFSLTAIFVLILGIIWAVESRNNSSDLVAAVDARFAFIGGGFFLSVAISFWFRRSPEASTRWKDLFRPVVAGLAVTATVVAMTNIWGALMGVGVVGLSTWMAVGGGFWDREISGLKSDKKLGIEPTG